ncbi:hypothetical protein BACSTE_01656 [Bacteroides stercoris ATCC 43183]|uniref:Uncharacterized protein n=1 Tax=Bacteroides stercoris ATCC 43183 TaxID=449673 RepID=B0NQK7_BACSE|nr:hypothetical protein BACSTE_01656 [Bacteroides stercoris ATCC 43183]
MIQQMYAILSSKRQRYRKKFNKKNANDCTISGIMRYHLINAWAHQWKRVINNGKSAG